MEALAKANEGPALAYGADVWTARADDAFRDLFGAPVEVAFCWGGTGANVVALQSLLRPWQAVICPSSAHINVDECGAPERFTGAKLIDVPSPDGKLRVDQLPDLLHGLGDEHHVQPAIISITQSTEYGTLYSPAEIAELCDAAHGHGLLVHMDGARIANAVAALGGDIRSFTTDAGVDVITFGGTKAGMMYGEAVIYLRPELGRDVKFIRKQASQLPSKMRYIAAQFEALLADGLWIELAGHANAMAVALAEKVVGIEGVEVTRAPEVNSMFATVPPAALAELQDWSFFWEWDATITEVRWMTSWATTPEDVETFANGVAEITSRHR